MAIANDHWYGYVQEVIARLEVRWIECAAASICWTTQIIYQLDAARTEEIPPTANDIAHMLYTIRKLHREPNGRETTLRYYYILDGIVYEAPTLASVLRSRMLKLGWHLREAFDAVKAAQADAETRAEEEARKRQ